MKTFKCSRCGKSVDNLLVKLESSIEVLKVTKNGTFIPYTNMIEPTCEYLCQECFEKYSKALDELNKEYNNEYLINMVETIDDIQYGQKE